MRKPRMGAGRATTNSDDGDKSLAHEPPCPNLDHCKPLEYLGDEQARCLNCLQVLERPDLAELITGVRPWV